MNKTAQFQCYDMRLLKFIVTITMMTAW